MLEVINKSGNLAMAVVEAVDCTHLVRIGKSDIDAARAAGEQWEAEGWAVTLTVGGRGRRTPLRAPYKPVRCDRCRWAGLNLGVHYGRAHAGLTPPEGPAVAEVIRRQTRAARATVERNRRPRRGVLVVKQPSDTTARVYRIERVDRATGWVDLRPFDIHAQHELREQGGVMAVSLEDLARDYRPVGTWSH